MDVNPYLKYQVLAHPQISNLFWPNHWKQSGHAPILSISEIYLLPPSAAKELCK